MKQFFTLLVMLCIAGTTQVFGQVTTSTIQGEVTDTKGDPLPGATIVATHIPSGTRYGVTSRTDGRYTLPNLRVGGPYVVSATLTGFQQKEATIEELKLAQRFTQNFALEDATTTLGEVTVLYDASGILNSTRTGAGSNITRQQIASLPTITRSAADYTRLVPMSAEGGSFAGRNDQFNNYSLDGTIFNNPFGLDAATPGGQADAQPVSLDAIDQINVAIAPYDVTQTGFTGAAVNAVTKSGTNSWRGTVFGFYRNKDMLGDKVEDTEVTRGDLRQLQTGFAVGGPIIKDKLFVFANLEIERRSDLGSYFLASRGTPGPNISRVLASDLELVSSLLKQRYNYETGAYENYKHNTDNQKGLIKLDWNINNVHKLTLTGNFLDAFKEKPAHPSAIGRRGPDFLTLQFQNSGYRINNKLYSTIAELKSLFGNRYANKLQIGFTAFRDSRDPFSEPFPVLNISKDGTRYIVAGHEPFSIHNRLDQNVYQINDNFTIYSGKHTVTLGGSLERFDFDNSFNLTGYGNRVFFPDIPIEDFQAFINSGDFDGEVQAARDAFVNNNSNNTWALAETNLGQFALYAQDEWAVSSKLVLTAGLRMDMPLYFNTPDLIQENITRKGGLLADGGTYDPSIVYSDENGNPITFDHTKLPDQKPSFSPRFGFNYDIFGDRSAQLRGGSGLFTGRFPFVWIGNQVANPDFFFYCVTHPDFKFPQVWRSNLGYDQEFWDGWIGSLDVIFTKDLNAMMVRNYGLKLPSGNLQGVDNRPVYIRDSDRVLVFGDPTNAYVFTNVSEGYSFNTTLQITKNWEDGSMLQIGYNFMDAQDVASIDAEISSDAYDRNPGNISHTNTPELAPSLYGNKHRFVGAGSKRFRYGSFGTTISIFSEFVKGGRYSYTYSGDINGDGSGLNDLIYIPTNGEIDGMLFSGDDAAQAAQRAGLKEYIRKDDYLNTRRGQYAEKYGALSPWYSHWDMRILQDYYLPNKNVIQLSLDILNFGNLLNSDWGVRQFATSTGLVQPVAVSVDPATLMPTYTFDTDQTSTFFNDFGLASRWQMQLGLRYIF
ncbi:MAG: TonB-dependent receptor [Lewinellaceae bacterium]|nr:TonB-dependent receptor [Saprospiraceae bacterium]MCB9329677.1 TonB-dependent receptor [Lewinellaceae bacterium]